MSKLSQFLQWLADNDYPDESESEECSKRFQDTVADMCTEDQLNHYRGIYKNAPEWFITRSVDRKNKEIVYYLATLQRGIKNV